MTAAQPRHYEAAAIFAPEFSDKVPDMVSAMRSLVEQHGGKVTRLEDWGKRELAYRIDKQRRAHYVLLNFNCAAPQAAAELQDMLERDDRVYRTLVTRTREERSAPSPVMVKEAAEAAEAAA